MKNGVTAGEAGVASWVGVLGRELETFTEK